PDARLPRERLGYRREGDAWKGTPGPARSRVALEEGSALAKERALVHREIAAALVEAARLAPTNSRTLAGLALDEDPENKAARARTVGVTAGAYRHYLGPGDPCFSVEGEEEPPAVPLVPVQDRARVRWIVVAASEHATFLEHAVADKKRHDLAKRLRSWTGWL